MECLINERLLFVKSNNIFLFRKDVVLLGYPGFIPFSDFSFFSWFFLVLVLLSKHFAKLIMVRMRVFLEIFFFFSSYKFWEQNGIETSGHRLYS